MADGVINNPMLANRVSSIPDNDLDNLKYQCVASFTYGQAPNILNKPINKGCIVFVFGYIGTGFIQIAVDRTTETSGKGTLSNMFIRSWTGDNTASWSDWKTITLS